MVRETAVTKKGAHRPSFMQHPFEALHQDMDLLFDQYMPSRITRLFADDEHSAGFARMDVVETDKSFEVKIDVPGVETKDIDITLVDNLLTIRGERQSAIEESDDNFYCTERSFGSFVRRVELPSEVDAKHVDAKIENGVLCLQLIKSAKAKAKEVRIKVKDAD